MRWLYILRCNWLLISNTFIKEWARFKGLLLTSLITGTAYVWLSCASSISKVLLLYLLYDNWNIIKRASNSISTWDLSVLLKTLFYVSKVLTTIFNKTFSNIMGSCMLRITWGHSHLMPLIDLLLSIVWSLILKLLWLRTSTTYVNLTNIAWGRLMYRPSVNLRRITVIIL